MSEVVLVVVGRRKCGHMHPRPGRPVHTMSPVAVLMRRRSGKPSDNSLPGVGCVQLGHPRTPFPPPPPPPLRPRVSPGRVSRNRPPAVQLGTSSSSLHPPPGP